MLCPYCQQDVANFDESTDSTGGRQIACSKCRENVPLEYPVDYESYPAVPVSIIGMTQHGKTVYISALIQELERLGGSWPGFYCNWLDENEIKLVRARLKLIDSGSLPDATRSVFPRPQILRLNEIPCVGGCQLLFFDTGGESFATTVDIREKGHYVRHSPSVVWLVSLKQLESPQELNDAFTVYIQAMAIMGSDVKKQSLIITLTKGDLLLNEPDLPQSAKDFLVNDNLDPRTDSWERLDKLSNDLEYWMLHSGYHNIVNAMKYSFCQVKYCIVSSQGAEAKDQQLSIKLAPRGVLSPVFWLWRQRFPHLESGIVERARIRMEMLTPEQFQQKITQRLQTDLPRFATDPQVISLSRTHFGECSIESVRKLKARISDEVLVDWLFRVFEAKIPPTAEDLEAVWEWIKSRHAIASSQVKVQIGHLKMLVARWIPTQIPALVKMLQNSEPAKHAWFREWCLKSLSGSWHTQERLNRVVRKISENKLNPTLRGELNLFLAIHAHLEPERPSADVEQRLRWLIERLYQPGDFEI